MFDKSFIESCLDGDATLFELDDYIEYWHTHDTDISLKEFIGMTDYEYEQWGKSSDAILRDILYCRQNNIEYSDYHCLTENERIAARSFDQEAIDNLKNQKDYE